VSILGHRVLRTEDPKLLTSGGTYVDDLPLEGAAHVTYVRSSYAHARIKGIHVDVARGGVGVVGVFTATDLDLPPLAPEPYLPNTSIPRPMLARDVVRYVGEPVAAVVTEELYQGPDASELVVVDYEPLPAVIDLEQAITDTVLVHPEWGSNIAVDWDFGRDEKLFDECEVVVRQRMVNQRVAPCPLEVRAAAARWDDGCLVHWASTQAPHLVRQVLAGLLGLEPDAVRVITPDVGGGFGAKASYYPEELLLGWIARRLGRPIRWVESRSESMVSLGHGRGQVQEVELGGTRDGEIRAYRLTVLQDCGAYPIFGSMLPFMTRLMASGVYTIPEVEFRARSVMTNTTPTVAYRGAGRPEATAAIERVIDIYAMEIDKDPVEVRRKNLIAADRFPYVTPTGAAYDSGDYERALDLVLRTAGYGDLRAEQLRRRERADVRQLGIGLAVYVEITNGMPGGEHGSVEVRTDGTVVVLTGTSPHGQGHVTTWSMIVAEQLGIPMDQIEVVHGDTARVRAGLGTMASRSVQVGGAAVHQASVEVVEQARRLAAELLEASDDDIVLDRTTGRFYVAGTPSVFRTWRDVAEAATSPDGLRADTHYQAPPTYPFGAHLAVVEVDIETGDVDLLRLVAVDDAGRILNPLLAEGQIHGGLAQGVAQALLEEFRYDDDGNPLTTNFADYSFISATELPFFETVEMETPTPHNVLGAKGIGESGTVGATPAVQNAVVDALTHLGICHIDLPAAPERVWRAIRGAVT
jgi:carbon-monoxide dehydrogenase large subunit